MAVTNLSNQHISASYQNLMQISSSNALYNGTGSLIPNLAVTASFALSASYFQGNSVSASYVKLAQSASYVLLAKSASFATTASYNSGNSLSASYAVTASYALTASFLNGNTTNAFVQNGNSFGTTALLGTNDNQSLALETNGATKMFISSSGNVGINTIIPDTKLHIEDVTKVLTNNVSEVAQGTLSLVSTDAQAADKGASLVFGGNYINSSSTKIAYAAITGRKSNSSSTNADGYLSFYTWQSTGLAEAMRITTSGNVGVGTTTPLLPLAGRGNLTINGSSQSILTLGVGDVWKGYLYSDGTNTDLTASGSLTFGTSGGVERMRINTSGNVGIATTTPNAKLDVNGNVIITGSLVITGSNTLIGNKIVTGSVFILGNKTITGSVFISGSKTVIGANTTTGSLSVSGSITSTSGFIKSGSGSQILLADGTTSTQGTLFKTGSVNYALANTTTTIPSTALTAGQFADYDTIQFFSIVNTPIDAVAIVLIEVYINGVPNMTGSPVKLATYNGPAAKRYWTFDRTFWIQGGNINGIAANSSNGSSIGTSGGATSTTSIPSPTFYLITQITTTSTDTARASLLSIQKI